MDFYHDSSLFSLFFDSILPFAPKCKKKPRIVLPKYEHSMDAVLVKEHMPESVNWNFTR